MKITTTNKQGQVVIPINLRKKFNITEKTYLKIYTYDDQICIKPLEESIDKKKEKIIVNFTKDYQQNDFHFHSKKLEEKDLSGKVDEILY